MDYIHHALLIFHQIMYLIDLIFLLLYKQTKMTSLKNFLNVFQDVLLYMLLKFFLSISNY